MGLRPRASWTRVVFLPIASVMAGLAVVRYPAGAVAISAGVAALLVVWAMIPEGRLLQAALITLLVVPFDNIAWLTGQWRVMAALGISAVFASVWRFRDSLAGRASLGVVRPSYVAWLVVLGTMLALQRDPGVLRIASVWLLALSMYLWVCSMEESGYAAKRVAAGLAAVGCIHGSVAVLDRLSGGVLSTSLPSYIPAVRGFGEELGLRATGLAGHPLRLGTLCMLGLVVCAVRGLEAADARGRLGWAALGVPSLLGLLLSGARGSWIGALVAVGAVAVARAWRGEVLRRPAAFAGMASVLLFTWSAFREYILTRMTGGGLAGESTAQRAGVVAAVPSLEGFPLLTGVGFSRYADTLFAAGLTSASVENEYVLSLLSGGVVLALALAWLAADSLVLAVRSLRHRESVLFGPLTFAMLINIGTYNPFSWTVGPALLSVVLASLAYTEWYANSTGR